MKKPRKFYVVFEDRSGVYCISKTKPKETTQPSCGQESCTACPEVASYRISTSVELCDTDFEKMLGKGFKKGINQVEIRKL